MSSKCWKGLTFVWLSLADDKRMNTASWCVSRDWRGWAGRWGTALLRQWVAPAPVGRRDSPCERWCVWTDHTSAWAGPDENTHKCDVQSVLNLHTACLTWCVCVWLSHTLMQYSARLTEGINRRELM